jgi:signal transduction histidine kinase
MAFRRIIAQLNIISQCRRSGLSLWQCPQFLFLIMGLVIIAVSVSSYLVGTRFLVDPELLALFDIIVTVILFIIAFIIVRSFERLAEASRMKSEFINIVCHQLRSPLTNIKWITDFLKSEDVKMTSEKEKEYFSHLKENISRMGELVDELLIVSRIEEGGFPLRKREASLEILVRELIARYKVFAEASNVKVIFYPQKDLPKAFFDPTLMKLVVENLIDNAIRYSKEKGEVEIWLEKKEKSLYFKIKDTGLGIPKADQKYIFQKFFRGENIMREQVRGSGLGLYITKLIVEKSGGRIWFESQEDKETTFYFALPIK